MLKLLQVVEKAILDLAWSLWTELGAPGAERVHSNCVVEPESLLAFCQSIAGLDPRVDAIAAAWKKKYSAYLSISRLRQEAQNLPESAPNPQSAKRSTGSHHRQTIYARPPGIEIDLQRPAAVLLRSRALFGVSARSDVVLYLLYAQANGLSAAQLATPLALNRYNLSQCLNGLTAIGFCTKWSDKNRHLFALAANDAVAQLLAPLAKYYPPWSEIFSLMLTCRLVAKKVERMSPDVAAIEADLMLTPFYPWLRRSKARSPENKGDPEAYWAALASYCGAACTSVAAGNSPLLTTSGRWTF